MCRNTALWRLLGIYDMEQENCSRQQNAIESGFITLRLSPKDTKLKRKRKEQGSSVQTSFFLMLGSLAIPGSSTKAGSLLACH